MQDGNPVIFVSRTLSNVEKRFSTIEKEFLAIVFTLTKLRMYLVGCSFNVYTDHKPICGLLSKPIDRLSHRLQRWILNIQHFQFNLSYLRGQSNVLADALSRFPVSCADSSITDAENPEYTLCFLLKSSPVDMKAVALAIAADPSLSVILEHISSSWSLAGASQVRPYFTFRDELTAKACRESDGKSMVVLRGIAWLYPLLCKPKFSRRPMRPTPVHKNENTIRAYAYSPVHSRDIDEYVRQCEACTGFQTAPNRPPVTPIAPAVSSPYEQISVDLTGPSESLHVHCRRLSTTSAVIPKRTF